MKGPEHPDTLGAMNNLAASYWTVGRRDEALKMGDEVLRLYRKVSGPEHTDTIGAMNNLATFCFDVGSKEEALKLREELLPLSRNVNGPDHPVTLGAMFNLAISYFEAGRKSEALKLTEEVLPLQQKVLGNEHPDTLKSMGNLATFYLEAGRREEGLKLEEEVLPLSLKVYGPDRAESLFAIEKLAISYGQAGRAEEALRLLEECSAHRPDDSLVALKAATLEACFGREADHFTTCTRLVEMAERKPDDTNAAERAARAWCLRPSTNQAMLARALLLARHAVGLTTEQQQSARCHLALGIAEYRAGNEVAAEQALMLAEESAEESTNGKPKVRPYIEGTARLFRAMILLRHGKDAEAQSLFRTAAAEMPGLPVDDGQVLLNGPTQDDMIFWLAYKEAKALLQPHAPASSTSTDGK
jgi:tetratricopeptide (TPR) repeat protein